MQLDKMIAYHKALADPTRIRLLCLLAAGEKSGLHLAENLGVSTPTITHHTSKLREASLIQERREKNTIYFSINEQMLQLGAADTVRLIKETGKWAGSREEENGMDANMQDKWRQSVLRNFHTPDGRLKHIPVQLKKKLVVLEAMAEKLEPGRAYPESEINAFVQQVHPDYATLRRELIMHGFMYRDKEVYELNPRQMWAKWEELQ
jgi:hypothetical protein